VRGCREGPTTNFPRSPSSSPLVKRVALPARAISSALEGKGPAADDDDVAAGPRSLAGAAAVALGVSRKERALHAGRGEQARGRGALF